MIRLVDGEASYWAAFSIFPFVSSSLGYVIAAHYCALALQVAVLMF